MTTTAKIAAKGCQATGITEQLATKLGLGVKLMVISELEVVAVTETADGDEKLGLRLLNVEPAPNRDTEDHLRNLQRSFHYERKLTEGGDAQDQLPLPGDGPEPKVADVLAAGQAHTPHPYIEAGGGICDVCGGLEGATPHAAYEERLSDDDQDADELDLTDPATATTEETPA